MDRAPHANVREVRDGDDVHDAPDVVCRVALEVEGQLFADPAVRAVVWCPDALSDPLHQMPAPSIETANCGDGSSPREGSGHEPTPVVLRVRKLTLSRQSLWLHPD